MSRGNETPRPPLPLHERTASFPSTAPARGQPRPCTCHHCPSRGGRELCSGASLLAEGRTLRSEGLSPPSRTYRPQAGPPDHRGLISPGLGGEDGWHGHLMVSGSPRGEADSPPLLSEPQALQSQAASSHPGLCVSTPCPPHPESRDPPPHPTVSHLLPTPLSPASCPPP